MEEINEKAKYCLNCKVKPCATKGCPLENNIPKFIEQIKENNFNNGVITATRNSLKFRMAVFE